MLSKLKSRELWIGLVAGIIIALAGAFGFTWEAEDVEEVIEVVIPGGDDEDDDSEEALPADGEAPESD